MNFLQKHMKPHKIAANQAGLRCFIDKNHIYFNQLIKLTVI